jgi:hypothetical protein
MLAGHLTTNRAAAATNGACMHACLQEWHMSACPAASALLGLQLPSLLLHDTGTADFTQKDVAIYLG